MLEVNALQDCYNLCLGEGLTVGFGRRKMKATAFELFVDQQKAAIGPEKQLQGGSTAIPEHKHGSRQWGLSELGLDDCGQPFNGIAEVSGDGGEKNPGWGWDHESASTTIRSH